MLLTLFFFFFLSENPFEIRPDSWNQPRHCFSSQKHMYKHHQSCHWLLSLLYIHFLPGLNSYWPCWATQSPEESGGREVGESVTFQLGLGGFPANDTDKVCFLEKIDKKQLATGWVRVGCNGVWCTKVCTTGSIIIWAVGLAAAYIMCFRLVYCNASTRGVIWTGMESIIQETRLFFWFQYKRSSEKGR